METKELHGVLFQNQKTSEKHPDYRGNCLIGGVQYRIAGWKKTSKNNLPYMSIAFTVDDGKYVKPKSAHTPAEQVKQVAKNFGDTVVVDEEPIDDLPF